MTPIDARTYQPPHAEHVTRTDEEIITKSWDANMHIWLRNLQGASHSLGDEIRRLAEAAVVRSHPLKVLDVIDGIPLKGLEIQGRGMRRNGDYLIYGTSPHPAPHVTSINIASRDWTRALLTEQLTLPVGTLRDLYRNFIVSSLVDAGDEFDYNFVRPEDSASELLRRYEEKLKSGKLTFQSTQDYIATLDELHAEGKRFDLVFVDATLCEDTQAYFLAIQRVLSPGGLAYAPIQWWVPNSFEERSGTQNSILIDKKVTTLQGIQRLEDYLSQQYPHAFHIGHFPGAKTVIIEGTASPLESK